MLLRKIDGEMNVQNCWFFAKWRRWWHAPWLTATAVITDSHHSFSKRWHVADVKNIAGDDQTTVMVHRNSANLACTFRIYVCLRLCDRDCCFAADGSGSCHAPASSYFEERTRCRRQILQWRWPGNPNGRSNFRKVCLRLHDRNWCSGGGSAADGSFRRSLKRHVANVKNIVGDYQDRSKFRKYANLFLRDQAKRLEKLRFCCYERRRDCRHCAPFTFLLSLVYGFCFHIRKIISRRPLPLPKNRDIHIVEFFCRFYL